MRTIALSTLAFLALGLPASAQMMCGPGQAQTQAQAQTTPAQGGGMMCGGTTGQTATDDPMADKPATTPQRQGMMCPCCRGMASMGHSGSMPGMR